jgi:1-hydroxycarotenoid 3,4-desaturase
MQTDVVVIGAGVGGLVAALELARQGLGVTLFERAAVPGGKLHAVDIDGARIDAGPTVFTMRPIFEEIFEAAGARLDDHLTLQPLDVLARHAWSAEEQFDLFADLERTCAAVARFAGDAEARRYRAFCDDASRTYRTLERAFLYEPEPGPLQLMRANGPLGVAALWRMRPFATLWDALGDAFRDERLRQLFARYATYCGASPFHAPATLMLIAHVERRGVWQVEGGLTRLADSLAQLAAQRGARLRYDAEVARIRVAYGRVAGVELTSGERIDARAVIVNADAAALAAESFGAEVASATPKVPPAERSLSAMTWALVVETSGFDLAHHNVFFSRDYPAEFAALSRGAMPDDPTVYVCAPDRGAPGHVLPGASVVGPARERLFCLINAPAIGDLAAFDAAKIAACADRTFARLERCGLTVHRDASRTIVTTPADFARRFPATGGALYGRACQGWRAAFQRPTARTALPGLYLAGGSAHPGAGLPMAALSGRFAAASLRTDLDSTSRSRRTATRGGMSMR